MTLRWGIASAGKISNDFVESLKTFPIENHRVVAVAARSLNTAETFAKKHNIPKFYEGYSQLAQDKEIDIVYIGTLNPYHYEVSKMMLEHGKHVLCEKPFAMTEGQAKALINLAKSKDLFISEAVWSRSFPVYNKLAELLKSNVIGEVLYVQVSFGFNLQRVPRVTTKEMGGGTILDLGIYVLQFQQFVFRELSPIEITTKGELNSEGVDNSAIAIISYPNGKYAIVNTSARAQLCNEAIIVGKEGIIRIPEFWCPTKLIAPDQVYDFQLPPSDAEYNFHNSVGLSYQAEVIRQCIAKGEHEHPNITHDETIQLARLMDTMRKQLGIDFPEDKEVY